MPSGVGTPGYGLPKSKSSAVAPSRTVATVGMASGTNSNSNQQRRRLSAAGSTTAHFLVDAATPSSRVITSTTLTVGQAGRSTCPTELCLTASQSTILKICPWLLRSCLHLASPTRSRIWAACTCTVPLLAEACINKKKNFEA